jgi:hypothetical protein
MLELGRLECFVYYVDNIHSDFVLFTYVCTLPVNELNEITVTRKLTRKPQTQICY